MIYLWYKKLHNVAGAFENDDEITDFVKCKIESLIANDISDKPKEGEKHSYSSPYWLARLAFLLACLFTLARFFIQWLE